MHISRASRHLCVHTDARAHWTRALDTRIAHAHCIRALHTRIAHAHCICACLAPLQAMADWSDDPAFYAVSGALRKCADHGVWHAGVSGGHACRPFGPRIAPHSVRLLGAQVHWVYTF